MTTNPPILRNSALALPVAVALGAAHSGEGALGAGLASLLVLGNLWVLSVVGPRLVKSLADGEFPGLWAAALVAKFFLLVGGFVGLVQVLPPIGVAMGFVPLMVGTLATAVQLAQAEAAAEAAARPGEA